MPVIVEVIGLEQLESKLTQAQHVVFPQAAARALNTTARTVRTESGKQIAQIMGLKQREVRDRTSIDRATPKRLLAQIRFKGRRLNLIRFKARQTKRGVAASPWGKRQVFPQTFIVDLGTGRFVGVRRRKAGTMAHERAENFRRADRVGRTPVVGVVGPGVAETAREMSAARAALVRRVLPERLKRELDFYVSRLKK